MSVWSDWKHTFDLRDIWKNDDLTFEQRRDAITSRMREQPWFPRFEADTGLVADLADAQDVDDWDYWWDEFYDWADNGKRVWVRTSF